MIKFPVQYDVCVHGQDDVININTFVVSLLTLVLRMGVVTTHNNFRRGAQNTQQGVKLLKVLLTLSFPLI